LLFRHKPEQYGYLPDGLTDESSMVTSGEMKETEVTELNITAKQAFRSRAFWHLAVMFVCRSAMVGAVSVHIMPYLSSVGISRSLSSLVATLLALVDAGPRIVFGWLADKSSVKFVGMVVFALMSLGLIFFEYVSQDKSWILIPFLILLGMGIGGSSVMRASIVREFFGRASFGAIYGANSGIGMIGSIAGAPIAGLVFDRWGSYHGVWFAFAVLSLIAVVSIWTAPKVKIST
jgi:MFS family permease